MNETLATQLSNLARPIFLVYNIYKSSGPKSSYPVGTKGSFPGCKNSCSVELTFYLHLASR